MTITGQARQLRQHSSRTLCKGDALHMLENFSGAHQAFALWVLQRVHMLCSLFLTCEPSKSHYSSQGVPKIVNLNEK